MNSSLTPETQRLARILVACTVGILLVVNLFVIGLGVMTLSQSREKYLKSAGTQAQNLAQALVYSISGVIETADVALYSVADEAQRQLASGGIDAGTLNTTIIRQHTRVPALDSVRIAGREGNIAYGIGVVPGNNKSISGRDYFITLRDNRDAGLVISKPVLGLISGKWVIVLARRINAPDGSFAGVVYCAVQLEKIRSMLTSIDVGPRGTITLRDGDLGLILRQPEGKNAASEIGVKPTSDEMFNRFRRGIESDSFMVPRTSDGTARLVTYRKIGRFPLYISIAMLPDDCLVPWRREMTQILALVGLFVLMTLALSRLIFVRWRRQLQAEEKLRRTKEELELRVGERTDALNRANVQLKRELSTRAEVEEELRLGRNMLAQIVDTIPQFVFWKDRDSNYLGCNMAFASAAGLERTELIRGKSDYDLPWLREESDAYRSDDQTVMDGNSPKYHIIEQQLQANGQRYWVDTTKVPLCDENGTVIGVLGVYDNITEKKALEESRDRALAMVESLLASSPTGIIVYEGGSGACVKANHAITEMVGGGVEQLLSQNFRETLSWRPSGMLQMAEQVLLDGQTRKIEVTLTTSFGKTMQTECFLSRFDVEGLSYLMFIAVDMTERKRLEHENRLIEAQMLHVQKLESLGVLAGGIAHDFNNILMVVLGNADLALMRVPAESPACENLVQIEHAASRAADLARQMLAYSGKGKFVIEKLDLTRIVKEMAQMLEVSISKKVLLRYDFSQDLPPISGDATQLRQVILNLVINASEAIGDNNGMIVVSTKRMACDRTYLSESWIDDRLPEGDYLALEVTDTGCGIERDIIPKIFDPFFTTKFTGRGLGMAAVLGIVRAHKGAIKIYSEPGKGSSFRLLLPCVSGIADPQQLPKTEKLWQGSGTVLVADDEESIRLLGRVMLEELGFRVLMASDGCEAVELFRNNMQDVVCVLLDLTMPNLDGEQTFRALRSLKPDVKVIMSSGYNEQEVSMKFVGTGLSGFIHKPYKVVEMSRKLQEVLEG